MPYASDGKTFTATAVGDPQCDGKPMTFTVSGRVENGQPVIDDSQIK